MRYEGVVIVEGAVIYRTRPMYRQDYAFAEAADWADVNGYWDATVTTQPRK
jgi:hypothetical protein